MTAAPFRQFPPDSLFEVSTSTGTAYRQDDDDADEGVRRRDAAIDLLRERRGVYVRRAQRALLLAALDAGTATADDVAAVVSLPPDVDARLLGAAPGALAHAGLLGLRGYVRSRRPTRHASVIAVWGLADRDAALAWLGTHPELPDDSPSERGQLQLFTNDEPATDAPARVSL